MAPSFPPALKRLGQNFLIDPNIVRKIVSLAALRPDDQVLEIGPGRGALTAGLCAEAGRVIAVEIDPQLQPHLQENLGHCRNLELRIGDALEFPFNSLPPRTVVVANLPYYASTPLLFALLDARAHLDRMVLMLQTEVALRLAAKPNSKDYRNPISADARGGRGGAGLSRLRELFSPAPNCGIRGGAPDRQIP